MADEGGEYCSFMWRFYDSHRMRISSLSACLPRASSGLSLDEPYSCHVYRLVLRKPATTTLIDCGLLWILINGQLHGMMLFLWPSITAASLLDSSLQATSIRSSMWRWPSIVGAGRAMGWECFDSTKSAWKKEYSDDHLRGETLHYFPDSSSKRPF